MLQITAFDDPSTYGGAAWELAKREVAALQSQLAASQKRERILREGLKEYGNPSNWYQREDFDTDGSSLGFTWEHYGNGPCVALDTITAAEEVKGCTGK